MTEMIEWNDERDIPVHITWSVGNVYSNDACLIRYYETVMSVGAIEEIEAHESLAAYLVCNEPDGTRLMTSGYDQWPTSLALHERDTYDVDSDESAYVINQEPCVDRMTRVEWTNHLAELIALGIVPQDLLDGLYPSAEHDLWVDSFGDTR